MHRDPLIIAVSLTAGIVAPILFELAFWRFRMVRTFVIDEKWIPCSAGRQAAAVSLTA